MRRVAPGKGSKATRARNERRRRLKKAKLWEAQVQLLRVKQRERRTKDDYRKKLNLNAVECAMPFNYLPKVPQYPYAAEPIEQVDDVVPLVDVSELAATEPGNDNSVDDVEPGDVVYIKSMGMDPYSLTPKTLLEFAQVHDKTDSELWLRVAESCLDEGTVRKEHGSSSMQIDYGDRQVEFSSIIGLKIVQKDLPIIRLNHFDVQW
ncbi:hypothetical protein TRICI_005367 [Trichomonascus ciferrii]|uniref:Uncharacterized protein n=1 Tax=Trichomonascus ciferrii TaxID=44093 RepID=A0A642UT48_9ASCO|nr:hypothetical protein TRICI_005367 [Trichomonascus ciferrii]